MSFLLLIAVLAISVANAQRLIGGKVTTADGKGIAGASIQEKGDGLGFSKITGRVSFSKQ